MKLISRQAINSSLIKQEKSDSCSDLRAWQSSFADSISFQQEPSDENLFALLLSKSESKSRLKTDFRQNRGLRDGKIT